MSNALSAGNGSDDQSPEIWRVLEEKMKRMWPVKEGVLIHHVTVSGGLVWSQNIKAGR